MTLTAQQLAAIRRQRRAAADATAEERVQQWVGEIFGFGDDDFLPDPEQVVGWMQPGTPAWIYCVRCSQPQPTVPHVPVYRLSHHAVKACIVCGRRLDSTV